ncbi:nucleotidyltransferase [Apibacter muscae]|uniref:Nucleotidyltransferase n=1 Tax=Apibacter muscae TaxID=2509004 RepID=A0A563DKF6_9FLAO|nr:nucleotidyltransferase [Apibacter muscae]TWP30501.1 nucleotidyltransferase [Apibacter muscae]
MARTITEIQNSILEEKEKHEALKVLNSNSKASIWRLFTYVVAYVIFNLELLFDAHTEEINTTIAEQKKGSLKWYRNKALAFQYGFDLLPDLEDFNNENYTEEEIENSKIIKYSAVTEATTQSRLIIKIATETGDKLTPINEAELEAFTYYLEEIKYAGVAVTIVNYLPDLLKLGIKIKRDPLVLDANGNAIAPVNGIIKPIEKTITNYLKALPFNGELVVSKLTDQLKITTGVLDVKITQAESAWLDATSGVYENFKPIDMSVIPESGYFTTEDTEGKNLITITYVV